MADGVRQNADEVSRAITILGYLDENIVSHTLTPPGDTGSNEVDLTTQVERTNRVIEEAPFCLLTITRGLTTVSETSAATDDQEAASFGTMGEYLRVRGPR